MLSLSWRLQNSNHLWEMTCSTHIFWTARLRLSSFLWKKRRRLKQKHDSFSGDELIAPLLQPISFNLNIIMPLFSIENILILGQIKKKSSVFFIVIICWSFYANTVYNYCGYMYFFEHLVSERERKVTRALFLFQQIAQLHHGRT